MKDKYKYAKQSSYYRAYKSILLQSQQIKRFYIINMKYSVYWHIQFLFNQMYKKNKIKHQYKSNRLVTESAINNRQHLQYHKKQHLQLLVASEVEPIPRQKPSQTILPETNFGIRIVNPYLYILLHLRSKKTTNILLINIPEICIFIGGKPYEIIYSQNGVIHGYKDQQTNRINYQQVRRFFKNSWMENCQNAQGLVCLKSQSKSSEKTKDQYIVISKPQLNQILYKFIQDPFFKNLQYIQNLLPGWSQTIKIEFDHQKNEDLKILAERDMENFKSQVVEKRQLGQEQYLQYCCLRIYLYLRFEHNIIIKKGLFVFAKIGKVEQYPFINIECMQIVNMTNQLKRKRKTEMQQRQKTEQLLKNALSKMSYYIPKSNMSSVKTLEGLMNSSYQNLIKKINFKTIDDNRRQQFKNQLAFKKLHPGSKITYSDLIRGSNFKHATNKLFKSAQRKPLNSPPKFLLKTYIQKKNRTRSQMRHSSLLI